MWRGLHTISNPLENIILLVDRTFIVGVKFRVLLRENDFSFLPLLIVPSINQISAYLQHILQVVQTHIVAVNAQFREPLVKRREVSGHRQVPAPQSATRAIADFGSAGAIES